MDQITETIAHFVGMFQIPEEDIRLRKAFEEFKAQTTPGEEFNDIESAQLDFAAPYQLLGHNPEVPYQAPGPEWIWVFPWSFVHFRPPYIPEGEGPDVVDPGFVTPDFSQGTSARIIPPEIDPPGSIANYITQAIALSDDDYFGVGSHGLVFTPDVRDNSQLDALLSTATSLSAIDNLARPGSSDAAQDFMTAAANQLNAFAAAHENDPDVFVHQASRIEGTYVNGELVDEAPKFEDHHKLVDDPEEEGGGTGSLSLSVHHDNSTLKSSVELDTGSNTLINSAVLTNTWVGAPVIATVGNHFELNAIIQINAWSNTDHITSAIDSWSKDADNPTEAFNIATFKRIDPREDDEDAPAAPAHGFPSYWSVTEITGDLLIMNWVQQFTFMMDNDIGIISASGSTAHVTTGDNLAVNTTSLYELGLGYDLMVVGGHMFDASIIYQLNLLFDNDMIGAVEGFETTGNGSISTDNNLLWNEGTIYNVGGGDRFDAMPMAYREAAQNFANGDHSANGGVFSDGAFAGLGGLRVLYVSGDVVNLNYFQQMNVLGDNDQVALAMSQALAAHPDADWGVITGANTLVNYASILDLDATGKSYVGGEQYSTEVLIQADIISTDPYFGNQDPDALVNEAVAFLDDEMLDDPGQAGQNGTGLNIGSDSPQSDGLQTFIA